MVLLLHFLSFRLFLLLGVVVQAQTQTPQQTQLQPEPASVSCNAKYSAPCARTNSKWLAVTKSKVIEREANKNAVFSAITSKLHNYETGFYPFVFERSTGKCVAHGANPNLVGLTMPEIFDRLSITYSDPNRHHERFLQGGWVQYLWKDDGGVNSKLAYVVPNLVNSTYYLGVGYENKPLPHDLPCSDDYDSWCSMTNVRSLVGSAQFKLYQAESIEAFEDTVFSLSFNPEFKIDGGFYTFMYNYDGRLKSHGVIHGSLGKTLADIFIEKKLGSRAEGAALHEQFKNAVENQNEGAWVQYEWRNSLDEALYTKIAFLVKIEFENESYYLGSGFTFATDEFPDGPFGASCSADSNLPCAFRTAFQLSSHTLSYAIASSLSQTDTFNAISRHPTFQTDNFYVFAYDFNGTCVAHGGSPEFVGMTLAQVFDQVNIPMDAELLHGQFRNATRQGGGWVLYDWVSAEGEDFQKISFLFRMTLDGRDYYGGIGFNHQPYPVSIYSDTGTRKDGDSILCSRNYDTKCSEVNSQSILGEALAHLTLGSSAVSRASAGIDDLNQIFLSISNNEAFRVNDFYVAVFSADGDLEVCENDDGSGCCVAHGSDPSLVGKTWQEILDKEEIVSIRGANLNRQLLAQSSAGGGWIEYPYSKASGVAGRKHAWAAKFRSEEGKSYYVTSDYMKTKQPPTCDACPSDMQCTRNDQAFCEKKPPPPITSNAWFKFLISVIALAIPSTLLYLWWQKRKWRKKKKALAEQMDQLAQRLEQQMQGMVEVKHDLPIVSPEEYRRKFGDAAVDMSSRDVSALWYWEEDEGRIGSHKKEFVLSGTKFVSYSRGISDQIEHANKLYCEGRGFKTVRVDLTDKIASTDTGGKVHGADTGSHYEVDFVRMVQTNSKSKYERAIHREELEMKIASEVVGDLPPLPEDIDFSKEVDDKEDLLPTFRGQIIQVSRIHKDKMWAFGSVLYDPLMDDALKKSDGASPEGLSTLLANALHDRPTSGWFPRAVTAPADVNVMHKLLQNLGGEDLESLAQPPTWDESRGDDRIFVKEGSHEYNEVANFFMAALYGQRGGVTVQKVERIQNLPLWQSYAVKKQTMKTRDEKDGLAHRVNNKDPNLDAIERRWLFHGTQPEVVAKIEKQGFNRAFAGRNAVAFGRGVYFARDASYSSHEAYSVPDSQGVQYMFLCRVAVGDWCKGTNGQLTPSPKPHNNLELFDSTVDNEKNPSIFVIYHDAQAYPEYLISFKRGRGF